MSDGSDQNAGVWISCLCERTCLWAKVIMSDNTTQTMPMLISNLISGYVTDYGMLMLAVLITTIPTAIVFFALQKNFVEGITGSVK